MFRDRHQDRGDPHWSLPDGTYNPVVTADGRRWRDFERAAEAWPAETSPPGSEEPDPDRAPEPTPAASDTREAAGDTPDDVCDDAPQNAPQNAPQDARHATDDARGDVHEDLCGAVSGDGPADGPADGRGGTGGCGEPVVDWFDRADRPPPLRDCRPYDVPGGLARPDPQTRQDLIRAVPVTETGRPRRFPDPRGTWIRLVNGGGPGDDPFRATNALDCALAVLSTWYGEPEVAAPRRPEYDRAGRPLLTGEDGGPDRVARWTGHRPKYVGRGPRAYAQVAQRLLTAGHGAAALLLTRWQSGGNHAWNAVNCVGEVIWIDGQRGHMAVEPPYEAVTEVFCLVIDREGRPA